MYKSIYELQDREFDVKFNINGNNAICQFRHSVDGVYSSVAFYFESKTIVIYTFDELNFEYKRVSGDSTIDDLIFEIFNEYYRFIRINGIN